MLRAIRRPSATACGQPRELVLEQDDVGDPLRHLGARAHRHRHPRLLQRRHVVDPVADHRRVAARVAQRPDQRLLLLGRDPAEDRVVLRRLGERLRVLGQLGALDHAGVARHPDRRCDRGDRRPRVAGDQLQVDVLLAHGGDRLRRRRAAASPPARPAPAAPAGGGVSSEGLAGSASLGLAEGDDPPPGRRLLLAACGPGPAAASAPRPAPARRGRPARSWSRRSAARSTSTPRRTALRRRPAPPRRGSARRSPPGCGCGRRRWPRSGPGPACAAPARRPLGDLDPSSRSSPSVSVPVLSTQIVSTAARLSVALICWTRVSLRASRTAATAKVTLISRTRPSGISVTRPAVAVCAASLEVCAAQLEGEDQQDRRQRHHHVDAGDDHPVDLLLQRRGRVAEGARLAGEPARVALLAHRVDLVVAGAARCRRSPRAPARRAPCARRRPRR